MQYRPSGGEWWMLAFFVSICFLAAAAGTWLSGTGQTEWYPLLRKPSGTPPAWLFGPVWSALYLCMGIAAWLVWRAAGWQAARGALILFFIQLGLNAVWSGLFFGLRRPGLALAEVLALWVMILLTLIAFQPWSRAAAWLLTPYLLWVAYAARLNFLLWRLNS